VLSNTSERYLDLFNFYTGEHFTTSQLTQYDTTKVLPKQYSKLATDLWNWPILYKYVQPLTDSQQYVKRLCDNENIEVYVVSISHPDVMKSKSDFIRREYPFVSQNNIIFIHNKQLLNLNCLIDDNPANLIGGKYHKILFDYVWNKSFNAEFNGCIRCKDWSDAYDEVIRELEAYKQVQELYE
jgi:5'(3')-deoxyribonucleotidase